MVSGQKTSCDIPGNGSAVDHRESCRISAPPLHTWGSSSRFAFPWGRIAVDLLVLAEVWRFAGLWFAPTVVSSNRRGFSFHACILDKIVFCVNHKTMSFDKFVSITKMLA